MRPARKSVGAGVLDGSRAGWFQLQKPLLRASENRPFAPTVRPKPIRFAASL